MKKSDKATLILAIIMILIGYFFLHDTPIQRAAQEVNYVNIN